MHSNGQPVPESVTPIMRSVIRPEIIVLGYDGRRIPGGVAVVTELLVQNLPNARIHPLKHCYRPALTDVSLYVLSLFRFFGILIRRRKRLLVHAIVASRGDRVRALPVLLACYLLRVPLCIQYHKNVDGLIFKTGSMRDRIINQLYRMCELHIFLSPRLRREFLEMAPQLRNTRIIHNALSNSWIGLRPLPLEERKVDLVFFGRWNAEKGIDVLIDYLQTTTTSIRCEIYSDHVPKHPIRNAVMRPWVPEEQVRSILMAARVVVLPSYLEAYPTVLLEALACGTPFVATNIGGIPDIATDSGGGILVQPGDPSALGTAIDNLLSDNTTWSKRSQSGWRWANRTCRVEQVQSLWLEAYASMQHQRRAGW